MRCTVVSPAQRAEMRGDISGSDALPEFERTHGKIAWQKTGDRAQVSGAVRREIRVILVKAELPESQFPEGATFSPAGKTPGTGAGPCGRILPCLPQSSGTQERCPVRAIKETDGAPKSR
jgi:hypothetical protein